jgi:predicted nucleotide-binding protein
MINDVVASMVQGASIALLVLTAEDLGADGTERARENVIYETGYCQARLGLRRAIILREEGTNAFTNTDGIVEIRFPKGHIRATFGDVVATIDREFPSRRRPK